VEEIRFDHHDAHQDMSKIEQIASKLAWMQNDPRVFHAVTMAETCPCEPITMTMAETHGEKCMLCLLYLHTSAPQTYKRASSFMQRKNKVFDMSGRQHSQCSQRGSGCAVSCVTE
jgi:hypothetical protein